MVTHWESSKKPLYVRTIWKDGQRHVILNCKDNAVQYKKISKCPVNSNRPIKSAPSSNVANLNVSTLKLLNTDGPKSTARCKTTTEIEKTSLKIATKRVSVNIAVEKSIRNVPLCDSLEIVCKEKSSKMDDLKETCLNLTNFEEPRNSLTDRVLMWLDLAIQNGNYPKPITINPPLEVFATQPIARKRRTFAKHRCFSSYHNCYSYEIGKYSFQVEGIAQPFRAAKNENQNFETVRTDDDTDEDAVISSRLEENVTPENISLDQQPKPKFGLKRQLHIFLPSLQKKMGLFDSDSSSKVSSCSAQKNENSREI